MNDLQVTSYMNGSMKAVQMEDSELTAQGQTLQAPRSRWKEHRPVRVLGRPPNISGTPQNTPTLSLCAKPCSKTPRPGWWRCFHPRSPGQFCPSVIHIDTGKYTLALKLLGHHHSCHPQLTVPVFAPQVSTSTLSSLAFHVPCCLECNSEHEPQAPQTPNLPPFTKLVAHWAQMSQMSRIQTQKLL